MMIFMITIETSSEKQVNLRLTQFFKNCFRNCFILVADKTMQPIEYNKIYNIILLAICRVYDQIKLLSCNKNTFVKKILTKYEKQ